MNYFFLAAGFFAFQLLFAYLVDLVPISAAFVVAAVVSLTLVTAIREWSRECLLPGGRRRELADLVLFISSFFRG